MIKFEKPEGKMETTLTLPRTGDFNFGQDDFQNIVQSLQWLAADGQRAPETIQMATQEKIVFDFIRFFSPLLRELGLPMKEPTARNFGNARTYLRTDNLHIPSYIEVYCEGARVLPQSEERQDRVLDGLEPNIHFFFNPAEPQTVRATCALRTDGWAQGLYLLIDLAPLCYLMGGVLPVIQRSGDNSLDIAPLDAVGPFIEKLRVLGNLLGYEKILRLCNAKKALCSGVISGQPEIEQQARRSLENLYARTVLEELGLVIAN